MPHAPMGSGVHSRQTRADASFKWLRMLKRCLSFEHGKMDSFMHMKQFLRNVPARIFCLAPDSSLERFEADYLMWTFSKCMVCLGFIVQGPVFVHAAPNKLASCKR
ncbi:hypothetical protein AVEN_174558-1 [Araneus ventricosus]|uniref:Uncharacterized protein n=1 Tax=Araneus ventricosus TaxID=182803 RepID=A0A4Y2KC71_ARAVE|nr:hypothetical protein AVEN_174558-1 [Araneus ventricosus]